MTRELEVIEVFMSRRKRCGARVEKPVFGKAMCEVPLKISPAGEQVLVNLYKGIPDRLNGMNEYGGWVRTFQSLVMKKLAKWGTTSSPHKITREGSRVARVLLGRATAHDCDGPEVMCFCADMNDPSPGVTTQFDACEESAQ